MMNFFQIFSKGNKEQQLVDGLSKNRHSFWNKFTKIIAGKSKIDEEVLDDVEELLITSDVGIDTTLKIINCLEQRVAKDKYLNASELDLILQEEIEKLLEFYTPEPLTLLDGVLEENPYVILVVGVNGVGKTTTIGKLAVQFVNAQKKVILGAGDTFRAAAVEQLKTWGARVGAPVIEKKINADPSSVAYDTLQEGIKRKADVVIIDTAGRLHTKIHLINELAKVKKTLQKCMPNAPHEILLVLDGSTGQNALMQAKVFTEAISVTAIAITKLDGTAKGGIVLAIADQFQIPIKYIGIGEKIGDLLIFNKKEFVASLFQKV